MYMQPPSNGHPEIDYPGLVSFLPLVYVAWADGILSPSEITEIREKFGTLDWVSEADHAVLASWLDPSHPPSTTQYLGWLRTIRRLGRYIPAETRTSLATLGVEMAQLMETSTVTPEAAEALCDIEAALGIVGAEACRELIEDHPRPAAPATVEVAAPSFEVAALTALLDGPYADLRDRIRTVLRDPVFQFPVAPTTEAFREQVLTWTRHVAAQGWGALAFPEAYGGAGSFGQFMVAFETLAYHDLSLVIKFGVQFGLWGGSVHQLGTALHHEKYLRAIGTLELPGCFAMTELGHGSNVREIETTARYDVETETFIIDTPHHGAHKEYIGNAARHGRMATVFAQLYVGDEHHGVHAFVVPIRDHRNTPLPGIRIQDSGEKLGLHGVDNGRLWFDRVRIPRENLLNRFAEVSADGTYTSAIPSAGKRFFTMLGTLVGGRISVAFAGLSAAKTGLTIAVRYAERRRQFGPKDRPEVRLLDYRSHQRRLLPRLAKTYAVHFALGDLRERFAHSRQTDAEAIEALANGLKAYATWHTTDTLQACREACGGQGYLAINRFAALKADTDIFTTFEGDNTVLLLQVAKGLLSDFKQEFRDMNFFGLLRYLRTGASTSLMEMNPIVTRKTDKDHLRDPEFHHAAFRYRERQRLTTVAKRLKKHIDRGMDSFDAFVLCQNELLELAHASVERVLLERFQEAVAQTEDPALRDVLTQLYTLFALATMEEDLGWYLAQGYVEGNKARAIQKQVAVLSAALRPQAIHLVDAFAIPPEVLAAPIALDGPVA